MRDSETVTNLLLLQRAVEKRLGLPMAETFDDVLLLARVLEHPSPDALPDLFEYRSRTTAHRTLVVLSPTIGEIEAQGRFHVALIWELYREGRCDLPGRIRSENLEYEYGKERNLLGPLFAMMGNGICVDPDRLQRLKSEIEDALLMFISGISSDLQGVA
jgi:hypothetical protein